LPPTVAALRWQDVDWTASKIRIRQNYVRGQFGTPKTRRPTQIDELRATFSAARAFGLEDEEIWQTVNRVCERTPNELRPEDFEKLIAVLAERIQAKRTLAG
jgi:hypothetical protein